MNFKKIRIVAIFLFVVSFFINFSFVSYGAKKNARGNRGGKISRKLRFKNRGRNIGRNKKSGRIHKKNPSKIKYIQLPVPENIQKIDEKQVCDVVKGIVKEGKIKAIKYVQMPVPENTKKIDEKQIREVVKDIVKEGNIEEIKCIPLPVSENVKKTDEEQIRNAVVLCTVKDVQNKDEKQKENLDDNKKDESLKKDELSKSDVKAEEVESNDLQKNSRELEFSVWIATVCNLDWPKNGEWDVETQKKRMCEILDDIKAKGISKVFFQVHPRGDAFYKSELFPWSKFITGEIGKAPDYDPLQFACEECEKRNIKLEAWINPFLISNGSGYTKKEYIDSLPVSNELKKHPEWFVEIDEQNLLLNVGIPQVRDMMVKEAEYILDHYGYVSGIHIDDYFYPYPVNGKELNYDDKKEYEAYVKGCGEEACLSLQDWRRDSVNQFVRSLGEACRAKEKTFSASPFGIWKNVEDSNSGKKTNGIESYFGLYCDSLKWVKEGWVDFIIPQIYWEFGNPRADFEVLANWWNDMCEGTNAKLSIGVGVYKVDKNSEDASWRDPNEIAKQIEFCKKLKNVSGVTFFRYGSLGNISDVFADKK